MSGRAAFAELGQLSLDAFNEGKKQAIVHPPGPLCPSCKHPMFGGYGDMPRKCFRGCEERVKRDSRVLYPEPSPDQASGPPCPKCHQPMHGGRRGLPWACYRNCIAIPGVEQPKQEIVP